MAKSKEIAHCNKCNSDFSLEKEDGNKKSIKCIVCGAVIRL